MMYINQSMTSDVLAMSAITITLLFLQRHRMHSGSIATDNANIASNKHKPDSCGVLQPLGNYTCLPTTT